MHDFLPTRRQFLKLSASVCTTSSVPSLLFASSPINVPLHGLSAFGELKYPADFDHFDYASPEAPKGGTFRFQPGNWNFNQNVQTFDTLNSFVRTGNAPPRMEMCFDSLMTSSLDEPDAVYGLIAQTVTISEDRNSFIFKLRPDAKFHDGSALTSEDVAFSYDLLKEKGHPVFMAVLTEMIAAEAVSPHEFRLTFSGRQSERTILAAIGIPILSKADLETKTFNSARLEAFLGSGPYRVARFSAGRFIEYQRVDNDWAIDHPTRKGLFHFDQIRIDFFSDRNAAFEAFKKGETEWRGEFTASVWATQYDFPSLQQGRVVKREFPSELRPSFYCMALNQRRQRFQDIRVRKAIALCFDFEWINRNLFYGLYKRSHSTFEGSPYMATGLPPKEELAVLEPYRGQIPDASFGEAVMQPESDGSGNNRKQLLNAKKLLNEAGWKLNNGRLQNSAGETFKLEYLVNDEVFLRVGSSFIRNLQSIGIDATIRNVDPAQYQIRLNDFDFDLLDASWSLGATPTEDTLTQFFQSESAEIQGSSNLVGLKDPAIDALVNFIGQQETRKDFTIAMKALDRVLRARMDWIPNWSSPSHRVAYWDKFGFKEPKPDYAFQPEILWWYDEEKARSINKI